MPKPSVAFLHLSFVRAVAALALILMTFGCAHELPRGELVTDHPVGYAAWEFKDPDRGGRQVPVRVWYPAEKRPGAGAERAYYLLRDLGVLRVGLESRTAYRDLSPASGGDFPVVLFSHGWGSGSIEGAPIGETLASRGFIVCSIGHTGNTYEDAIIDRGGTFRGPAIDRPADVRFILDRLEVLNRSEGPFRGAFDMQNIGMIGHSFGGYTAVAAAIGHGVPRERRLKAIMPVVPAYDEFTDDELRSIDLPFLQIGAAEDDICPVERNVLRADHLLPKNPLGAIIVNATSHYHFSTAKEIGDAMLAAGIVRPLWSVFGAERLDHAYEEATRPERLSVDRAHRIEAFYALAFFLRRLRGQVIADDLLSHTCAAAIFPEVTISFDRPMTSD